MGKTAISAIYASLIRKNVIKIKDVPKEIRAEVKEQLEAGE